MTKTGLTFEFWGFVVAFRQSEHNLFICNIIQIAEEANRPAGLREHVDVELHRSVIFTVVHACSTTPLAPCVPTDMRY